MAAIKCDNCGANLQTDTETAMKFCPYCGFGLKVSEDIVDLAKFKMKHDEEVRQRIVNEENAHSKRIVKRTILIVIASLLAMAGMFYALFTIDEDHKMDRLSNEVQKLILQGDYETASIKVEGIRVEKKSLFDDHFNKYENLRNDLKKLIEQKKRESN